MGRGNTRVGQGETAGVMERDCAEVVSPRLYLASVLGAEISLLSSLFSGETTLPPPWPSSPPPSSLVRILHPRAPNCQPSLGKRPPAPRPRKPLHPFPRSPDDLPLLPPPTAPLQSGFPLPALPVCLSLLRTF